ncbi:SLOG family protein [Paenibacillus sp. YPG26]|uniref:SLOG family protein n=1 Tax=Paenibacillus sp. YPG26 TaxID=2878915 RepID=UPI00203B2E08|nr:SLOG family protein [Paenibacillus sp. YPG26]USB33972.1 SLOG family protein [Paenibacillus sp. YPG26]
MTVKNLLVTGYRAHELGIYNQKHEGIKYIRKAITGKLIPLIEEGLEWVITPGQYGVDLWAAEAAIELKKEYPHLKCSIITAYKDPEEKWKEDKKEYYEQITRKLDYYASVSNQPYDGVWQLTARDDLLLRKTEGILLFYDEDAGEASPKFMKKRALKKHEEEGYLYLTITSEDIQTIADEEVMYERPDDQLTGLPEDW